MTYRKEIEIDHKHSLNEHEIIEVLNALSSQAAYGEAWKTHCQETTGIDPDEMTKLVKKIIDLTEENDLLFSKLDDLEDMVGAYPSTYYKDVASFSPYRFFPLSTPTPN